ncbi:XRE family transcriptional regulator [Niallia circulans]|uniref:XRE family transcriptional regulator n=1 Tax=Niallia circulans TaxID=1397 RepID=A0A553SG36_NIACI|nr:helix-turn-helix transcriptional regulator [Niallia circulans]TRZ35953.1 XRE family transcriptional regulator [Niallia circulans]
MKFATWLRRKRESLSYTQAFVAKNLGVTRQAIVRWENANTRPNYEMLLRLLDFYGCSNDEILEFLNTIRI